IVRKTESRLPAGVDATGLGESVAAADGRCALVSFITAPLATGRANTYVVFVTDAALAGAVESFEWSFAEDGVTPVVVTADVREVRTAGASCDIAEHGRTGLHFGNGAGPWRRGRPFVARCDAATSE